MARGKKYTAEQIIAKFPEAEVLISQGKTQELAVKKISVSLQTLIHWLETIGAANTTC